MKVLITGGTGFLGLSIARRLIDKGTLTAPDGTPRDIESIVLFDASAPDTLPAGLDARVTMISGDIADGDTVRALFDRDDMSVFHLASVVSAGGERDFDLAMRVNLDGARHVLEGARALGSQPRVIFTSSLAAFGGAAMPDVVGDVTRTTPQSTYGMTKAVGELLVNDYTRKGFIDGRTGRLPTVIIRPGAPNAAASSFCSGLFREPLQGLPCALPVSRDTMMPVIAHRTCVEGIIALHEASGDALGDDRALNLPSLNVTVAEMVAALERVAQARNITLGPISDQPDATIAAIVSGWPKRMAADRARALGLPCDENLETIIGHFIDDFLVPA